MSQVTNRNKQKTHTHSVDSQDSPLPLLYPFASVTTTQQISYWRRARASHVQAWHHGVQLSARTSSPVPDRCLSISLQRHNIARSTICQSTTAGSTMLQAWHILPAGFHCGWPVGVERAARLPEWSGSQQGHIQKKTLKRFIRTLPMHAAH